MRVPRSSGGTKHNNLGRHVRESEVELRCPFRREQLMALSQKKKMRLIATNGVTIFDSTVTQSQPVFFSKKKASDQIYNVANTETTRVTHPTWWINSSARWRMEMSGSLRQSTMVERCLWTDAASSCTTFPSVLRATYRMLLSRFRRNLPEDIAEKTQPAALSL